MTRFSYAGFWHRFFARLIDVILLVLAGRILGISGFQSKSGGLLVENTLISAAIGFLYFTLLNSSVWQGTVGKKLLGLRVCDLRGRRITYGRAVRRYITEVVLQLPLILLSFLLIAVEALTGGGKGYFYPRQGEVVPHGDVQALEGTLVLILLGVSIFLFVNYFRVAWTPRKQTYYDQWAGTLVLASEESGNH